jgi:hypothetical protein
VKEKEMKKKYESGNYIIIKLIDDGWSYEWKKTDSLYNGINTKEMKLIHKKHEEVLNAWLMDNDSIIIRIKSHLGSYLELDFIGTYDESNNYSLDEAPLFTKEPEQPLEDLKKEKPVSLKQISKDIDTLIDTATPFQMEMLAQWLKNKSECVECIGILEESFNEEVKNIK